MPDKVYNVVINIRAQTTEFTAGMKKATGTLDGLGRTVGRIARTMSAFFALWAARSTLRNIAESVKAFAEFEKGITNVGILLDEGIGRLGEWNQAIADTATDLGLASKDLTKAAFDIQSATNDTSLSLKIFREAAKLAVAGGSDLQSTVRGALTLNEAYASSFSSVADMMDFLIVAQKKARATIGELSTDSSKFLGVAASLGIKVEELFAVYAQLTRGFGNTREAATALSAIMNALQKPSQKMIDFAQRQYGTSIQQAIATHGLVDVMRQLQTVAVEDIGTTLGRMRANRAYGIVRQHVNTIDAMAVELSLRQGKTQEKLTQQMATSQIQISRTAAEFERLKRAVGKHVVEQGTLENIHNVTKSIREMTEAYLAQLRTEKAEGFLGFLQALPDPTGMFAAFKKIITGQVKRARTIALRAIRTEMGTEPVISPLEWVGGMGTDETGSVVSTLDTLKTELGATFGKFDQDSKTSGTNFKDMWDDINENMKTATVNTMTTISSTMGSLFADVIVEGKSAADAFTELWKAIARQVIELIAQMIAKLAIFIAMMVAAKFLDPFTGGGASVFVNAIRKPFLGFQHGGVVPGVGRGDKVLAALEPGEMVVPRQEVKNFYNNAHPTVNVSLAGAVVLDDPIAVERLYREHLRDRIRSDIRGKRDTFYG